MIHAVKALSDQALKAYSNILGIFNSIQLDIKTKLLLFDRMIVPILTYGSEVWGVYNFSEVDKVHIKFLKQLLCVRNQTPNSAVYGEVGRYPLLVTCKLRALNYWAKISKQPKQYNA